MNKIKLCFSDISIEIESSDESTEEISNRAVNGLSFLIQERLKFDELVPGDEDSGGIPPQPDSGPVLPNDISMMYW